MQLGDDKKDAGLFEVAVGKAVDAQKLGAAHFPPDAIDAVVDDAGLIRLAVARDDRDRVRSYFCTVWKFHGTEDSREKLFLQEVFEIRMLTAITGMWSLALTLTTSAPVQRKCLLSII